jgi:hypothetical protein
MRGSRAVLVLAAVVSLAASGCHSLAPNLFGEKRARPTIRINVTNLNFQDATLYGIRAGERHRLGTVTGKGTGSFTMAWPNPQPFQIEIDLLAGGRCTTRAEVVDAGTQINLQIEIDLRRQTECVGD